MANLQIKGMDDDLYAELSRVAAAENRSISQQVPFLIKGHLARHKSIRDIPTRRIRCWQSPGAGTTTGRRARLSAYKKGEEKRHQTRSGILMYLLDTDTIIFNLKGNEGVRQALRTHLQDPLKISVITLMELYYGAFRF